MVSPGLTPREDLSQEVDREGVGAELVGFVELRDQVKLLDDAFSTTVANTSIDVFHGSRQCVRRVILVQENEVVPLGSILSTGYFISGVSQNPCELSRVFLRT